MKVSLNLTKNEIKDFNNILLHYREIVEEREGLIHRDLSKEEESLLTRREALLTKLIEALRDEKDEIVIDTSEEVVYKVGQVWTDPNNDDVTMEIIKIEVDRIPPRIVVKITYEDEEEPCTDIGYFGMQGTGWDFHGHYKLSVLKTD